MLNRRLFSVFSASVLLGGCVTIPGAPEGSKSETVFIDHVNAQGAPIKLEVVIYLPPGNGPFDVALFNHGSHTAANPSFVLKGEENVAPFLKKRIAVVALIRQGRGASGGSVANLNCNQTLSAQGFERDYRDVLTGLRFIEQSPLFRGRKVYTYGQSRGGMLSAMLAVREPMRIAGAVGFGTGWQAVGTANSCRNGQDLHDVYFQRLASEEASPTLFLYAENDSFFPPSSNTRSFELYQKAGGTGTMKTYPFVSNRLGDGHYFFLRPDVWGDDVVNFLKL
jgi:dienelactone hydrolase